MESSVLDEALVLLEKAAADLAPQLLPKQRARA
jgi:hypothetical protein